jgi:hypothetical protein
LRGALKGAIECPLPQKTPSLKTNTMVSVKKFFIEDFLSKKFFQRFAPEKKKGGMLSVRERVSSVIH